MPLAFRTRRQFHDTPGDIIFRAALSALAPFALAAALLAIPADEARAHDDTSATLHAETIPLYRAAENGDLDSVNHFITVHMANVNGNRAPGDWTPLHGAAWQGYYKNRTTLYTGSSYVSIISVLIAAGAYVNARDIDGRTPLHLAATRSFDAAPIAISMLIAAGADVTAKDNNGRTPLHRVATYDRGGDFDFAPAAISMLIAAGADVNAKDNSGKTPLYFVAILGHASAISMLIAAGADVNAETDDGETTLHRFATDRNVDFAFAPAAISMLIAAGVDVNAKDNSGKTPLHNVASITYIPSRITVVSAFIAAGADVTAKDNNGKTPLHLVATNRRRFIANYASNLIPFASALIAAGADVNAKDNNGKTPLGDGGVFFASGISRYHSFVAALIALGGHWGEACESGNVVNPAGPSPPCICEPPNVETNLGACEVVAVCDSPSVLNAGTNRCDCPAPNIGTDGADAPGDCHAEDALHEAALAGDLDSVNHFLADHMASVNATISGYPHYGGTPLHSAMRSGVCDSAIASKLIAAGADINANASRFRETPLNIAVARRAPCPAMVSVLVGAGANVCSGEGCSYNAWTPLRHIAGTRSTNAAIITVAQIFIQRGDNVNGRRFSNTPLYEAWVDAAASLYALSRPHGWFDLVDFLIENGGHYGTACTKGHIVNPRPIAITLYSEGSAIRRGERDACICPAGHIITDLGECEILAVCASPSVLDAGANRCDCPAPNVGTDGADAPGVCAVPSAQVCGGEDPPEYYAATLSACVPFADCRAGATLDGETNTCECAPPSALDGTRLGCEFTSASCMAATLHYTGTACEPLADCTAPAVRNEGTNLCECLAPNLNFGGGDCRAPSAANCAEHYDPPKFYDQAAGECGNTLFPCHDSAKRKADNSGCECPAGTFAHGDPSGGYRRTSQYGARHKNGRYEYIPDTAECHADHAPISHSLSIRAWGDAIKADNATLALHFISQHEYSPNALIKQPFSAYGIPPLHFAIGNDAPRVATILIDRGADTDATTLLRDGLNTPLHLAARKTDTAENVGLISFLLGKGADPNPRNSVGWRPLDLSFHGGNAATWQARRGIMAALIAGGATWSDECTGGAIPNEGYRGTEQVAIYPECKCPPHISQRDDGGTCECPAYSHSQVNGRCLPKDSAQVEAEILKMETELLRLRTVLASLNLQLSLAVEAPREMVEEIAEQAGDTAQEIKRRRDNFLALARADLAGAPPPPVAMSDTAAECRMLGGEVQIHSATGIRICSGIDANDTFCLVDSGDAYPCRGLFRHVRTCNDDYNRRALNPFFCGARCGAQKAVGKDCAAP